MTEKEFDERIEAAAKRAEARIEDAAERFDRNVTNRWEKSSAFRRVICGISLAAEAGLLIGGVLLAVRGWGIAAAWCLGLAIIALAADAARIIAFGGKRR